MMLSAMAVSQDPGVSAKLALDNNHVVCRMDRSCPGFVAAADA